MPTTVNPTQDDIATALRAFLLAVLPDGTAVVLGQVNRASEPLGDFVVMWPIRRERIETNVDGMADALFEASIAGDVMTVVSVSIGEVAVGNTVFGSGVVLGTRITALGSGTGGPGTYAVSPSQSAPGQSLAAGATNAMQPTEVTMQLDVHGPASADNAQIVSTLFRDPYATELFATIAPSISPLFADDPRQIPFINAEDQYEDRWVIDAHLQANQTVVVPQQYADAVEVEVISVDAAFPA